MKKMIFILAASAMLAACGGSGETPASDSTVAPIDSVVAPIDPTNVVTDSAQFNDAVGGSSSSSEIKTTDKDNESLEEIKLP